LPWYHGGMEIFHWIEAHRILEDVGIIASLLFTAMAFRREHSSRQIDNLLKITAAHREIWTALYHRPELARVLEANLDLQTKPITNDEALFMTFLLHHLGAAYRAMRKGMFITQQALDKDIRWFLALPIPNAVWQKSKSFLEPDFVAYVDDCLAAATVTCNM